MKGAQMRKTILYLKFILFCLCLTIALAGVSLAQQAAVSGVVKDSTGAVIPGATVLILKTDTATRLTTSSNEVGRYEFPSLQPGPYEIHVDKAGFQPLVRGNGHSAGRPGVAKYYRWLFERGDRPSDGGEHAAERPKLPKSSEPYARRQSDQPHVGYSRTGSKRPRAIHGEWSAP